MLLMMRSSGETGQVEWEVKQIYEWKMNVFRCVHVLPDSSTRASLTSLSLLAHAAGPSHHARQSSRATPRRASNLSAYIKR
jgi:hypothetical protein